MARTHEHLNLGEHLKPLSEMPDYKVESGDPDPRGWNVVTTDGQTVGRVEDLVIDTSAMKVRHLIVTPAAGAVASGETVLLDATDVDLRDDARQVVARTFAGGQYTTDVDARSAAGIGDRTTAAATRGVDQDRKTLTRSEEELNVGKREVKSGEGRVAKHVETEHVREPITRRHEELVVERRPVETGARADASIREDEIRVPLMEEEVVVEKRPVVKEELVVGKRMVEERDVVEADVRREKFDVENPQRTGTPRGSRNEDR